MFLTVYPILPRRQVDLLLSDGVRLMGVENKKAVKSDPGEKTPQLVADALPHSGSGSGLTAHLPWFSHLAMFALYHAMSGCAIPELRSGLLVATGPVNSPQQSAMEPPTRLGTVCPTIESLIWLTISGSPHACRFPSFRDVSRARCVQSWFIAHPRPKNPP